VNWFAPFPESFVNIVSFVVYKKTNHGEHEVHEEREGIEVVDGVCSATGTTTSGCLDGGRELVRTFPGILREHRGYQAVSWAW
jgi:hypothetical protein